MNVTDHADVAALAAAVADAVSDTLAQAVATRGRATVALAGGSTPAAILPLLFARALPWAQVVLTVSDERWVAITDPLSNAGQVERLRTGTRAVAAAFIPPVTVPTTLADDAAAADAALAALEPFDLVWAGVGADGHTLSWFPGPDYAEVMTSNRTLVGLNPQPLPPAAAVARLTLTRAAAARARAVLVVATGADKRAVLDRPEGLPVAALPASAHIHWAP